MINRAKRRKRVSLGGNRKGLSLVELIVAMVMLAVGLLGLASLSVRLSKQQGGSLSQQFAALVVQSRFDSLASIHCQSLAPSGPVSGTVTTRGITERWSIVDGNDIKTITDSVTFAARKKPLAYVSVIPCRD
ncbi:MAG TPA: prepilin-type N-terminal cleavage/methylation domain-containing protein [Gemmatimonadaceae bacterium]|nr:prepilin-type N-terminal cleavage/methylation domain-containing protein [Gemmatimonadaceae bacterium]